MFDREFKAGQRNCVGGACSVILDEVGEQVKPSRDLLAV